MNKLPSLKGFINMNNNTLVPFKEVRKYLPTKSYESFAKEYKENGCTWAKGLLFVNGVDFYSNKVRFLFDLEKAKNLPDLSSFREAGRMFGINYQTICSWRDDGLIEEGLFGGRWIDLNWFEKEYSKIMDSRKSLSPIRVSQDKLNFIKKNGGEEIYELIESYISARINGHGIIVAGETKYDNKMDKPEKNAHDYRTRTVAVLYGIICNRCGIRDWNTSDLNARYRDLSENEIEKFDASKFKIWDITRTDIEQISSIWSDVTKANNLNRYLKPFLYFTLSQLKGQKRQLRIAAIGNDRDKVQSEIESLNLKIELFEEGLEEILPLFPSSRVVKARKQTRLMEEEQNDYRLTRLDIVKMMENFRFIGAQELQKRKAVLLFDAATALRPNELANVKLKHLELNKDFLLEGYTFDNTADRKSSRFFPMVKSDNPKRVMGGILRVRYSKGSYSPSPIFGNYIPYFAFKALNTYLMWAFENYPAMRNKEAYLFPKSMKDPFTPYKKHKIGSFITKYRNTLFSFLDAEDRKNITTYALRHAVADWIVYKTNITDPILSKKVVAAGQIHLRHESTDPSPDVPLILSTYAGKATSEEYYKIMIEALNFPVTEKELLDWEISKGLRQVEPSKKSVFIKGEAEEIFLNEKDTVLENTKEVLSQKQKMYEEIKHGWRNSFQRKYGITREDFFNGDFISDLKHEIEELEGKILGKRAI